MNWLHAVFEISIVMKKLNWETLESQFKIFGIQAKLSFNFWQSAQKDLLNCLYLN